MSSSCQVYYSENPSKVLSVSSYAKSKDEAHGGREREREGELPHRPHARPSSRSPATYTSQINDFSQSRCFTAGQARGNAGVSLFFFFPPSFRPSSFPVLVSDLLCQSLKFILFHFDLFVSISCFPSTCVQQNLTEITSSPKTHFEDHKCFGFFTIMK